MIGTDNAANRNHVAGMAKRKRQTHWLVEMCRRAGKNQAALARHLGIGKSRVTEIISGKREVQADEIGPMAEFLNVNPNAIVANISGRRLPSRKVPLVGYLTIGSAIVLPDNHTIGGGVAHVDAPPIGDETALSAIRMEGDSMRPAYKNGDLIYYDSATQFNVAECIGDECVVRLANGEHLLAELQSGSIEGAYILIRHNAPPILNAEVVWAAPVAYVGKARKAPLK